MYRRHSPSPHFQWLYDHGYTQTRLRKEYNYTGALAPLAKELLPEIMKDKIRNKNGHLVTTEQEVMYALHHIRGTRTKGTRGDARRRAAALASKTTVVLHGFHERKPKIAPQLEPPPLTPIGELLKMMAVRIPEAGRQLDESLEWLEQTQHEFERLRADLIAMQGLLRRSAVLPATDQVS